MKLTAYYLDGRVEEYNTDAHYSTAGLFGSANVGVVSYSLYMDSIDDGLWMQFRYYDSGEALSLPVKGKNGYGAQMVQKMYYPILTKDDLAQVAFVECDGTRILWRAEPDAPLVNGIKFAIQSELFVNGKDNSSLEQRAVDLFRLYRGITENGEKAEPRMPKKPTESIEEWEKRIADHIGWDYGTLKRFLTLHKDDVKKSGEVSDASENQVEVDIGVMLDPDDILPAGTDYDEDYDHDFEDGFEDDCFNRGI